MLYLKFRLLSAGRSTYPTGKMSRFILFCSLQNRLTKLTFKKGPLIMSTEAEIAQVEANYVAGKLGRLE